MSSVCDENRRSETSLLNHVCNHSLECNYSHYLTYLVSITHWRRQYRYLGLPLMDILIYQGIMLPVCSCNSGSYWKTDRVKGALIAITSLCDPNKSLSLVRSIKVKNGTGRKSSVEQFSPNFSVKVIITESLSSVKMLTDN